MSSPPHLPVEQLAPLLDAVKAVLDREPAATTRTIETALNDLLADRPFPLATEHVVTIVAEVQAMRRTLGTGHALVHAHLASWAAGHLGDPVVQGHAWGCLSVTLRVSGRLTIALPLHTRAVEQFQRLVHQAGRADLRPSLARVLNDRGVTHEQAGQLDDAVEDYSAACAMYHDLVAEHDDDQELRSAWALTLNNRGRAHQIAGRLSDALADLDTAEAIVRRLVEREGRADLLDVLATALRNRAIASSVGGRHEAAVDDAGKADAIYQALVGQQGRGDLRAPWALTLNGRGNAYRALGRLSDAVHDYVAAEAILRDLVEHEGRNELRDEWAGVLSHRGAAYHLLGRLVEAVADYSRSERIYRLLIDEEQRSELRDEWAVVRNNRGSAYQLLGQFDEALGDHMIAEETLRELVEHEDRRELRDELAGTLESRGNARRAMENLAEALADHSAAEQSYRQLIVREGRLELRPSRASTLLSRGGVYQRAGRLDEARADYQKAERIYRQLVKNEGRTELRSRLALALASLGSLQIVRAHQLDPARDAAARREAIARARGMLESALAEAGDMLGVDWELAWKVNDELGDICRLTDDLVSALKHEEAAIDVLKSVRRRQGSSIERSVFLEGKVGAYLDAAGLGLTLAQRASDPSERQAYVTRAYGALLELKARDLTEALDEEPLAARLDRLRPDEQAELTALFAEADKLRSELFRQDTTSGRDRRAGAIGSPQGCDG